MEQKLSTTTPTNKDYHQVNIQLFKPLCVSNPFQTYQTNILIPFFKWIEYIILEDLTAGMSRPCICDLKMGANSRGSNWFIFLMNMIWTTIIHLHSIFPFFLYISMSLFYFMICLGYDPEAGLKKMMKQTLVHHITTSASLGFRIVGMKVNFLFIDFNFKVNIDTKYF
jgi:hypothetical protein